MKTADHIEAAEEPLDVVLPLNDVEELQRYFGIYTDEQS